MYEQKQKGTTIWRPVDEKAVKKFFTFTGYGEKAIKKALAEMDKGETYYLGNAAVRRERANTEYKLDLK